MVKRMHTINLSNENCHVTFYKFVQVHIWNPITCITLLLTFNASLHLMNDFIIYLYFVFFFLDFNQILDLYIL